ncbi:DUF6771 family protein [Sphingomonas turrisvirgatae]|uniref:DUF6771 family protein n=1 Tax=Sphingomonas turrisvirgatae TaxID=1888892 RepID=UPI0009A23664|nr:DUF6771 family protein [Sphingomonas turrisvirgatae]
MERVAPTQLVETILSAPAWARVGITAPSERVREEAALQLARSILGEDHRADPRQLVLTL